MRHVPDFDRMERIGLPDAIRCDDKSGDDLTAILRDLLRDGDGPTLLTRLTPAKRDELPANVVAQLKYDKESWTATLRGTMAARPGHIGIITAGTSDGRVALEIARTFQFCGVNVSEFFDLGVDALWKLDACLDEIRELDAVIVCASGDAALVSVVAGLIALPVIAVPTSSGYGLAEGGRVALDAALASRVPGVTVVNIDNGFGAACAALRMFPLRSAAPAQPQPPASPPPATLPPTPGSG